MYQMMEFSMIITHSHIPNSPSLSRKTSVGSLTNHATLLLRSHTILFLYNLYFKTLFPHQSAVMAYPLRPDKSNMLRAGSYKFHKEDVELIYNLYSIDNWTLWLIKESKFEKASIRQIAVAVSHGRMDQEKKYTFKGLHSPMIL